MGHYNKILVVRAKDEEEAKSEASFLFEAECSVDDSIREMSVIKNNGLVPPRRLLMVRKEGANGYYEMQDDIKAPKSQWLNEYEVNVRYHS